ncbi:amidohydrolase family protein [Marinomonas mediterranea]|uniref:Amidohydrolase 2 n=1 Tax=Marinomonas mediterranea (strain ATCC 700492 / JCM 21426 / NBRC 103028 / MMB-1) TaxID=717774 RepID=F2JVB4_MARM1|nr:amidohydrolase family protein [Marinomonas mediterranea]ADZ89372.1 amidohydrolase 2 [Marinomonas mediterranea MMB-1]
MIAKRILFGQAPKIALPEGAIDSHMHVYSAQYPSLLGGPDLPADAACLEDYQKVQQWLGLKRVVITQPNAYQIDNTVMLEALDVLGERGRGVVVVTPDTTEEELEEWHARGARGARIMQLPQGAAGIDKLLEVNAKIKPFGWTCIVQFYGNEILEYVPTLEKIQGDYVIDHFCKFIPPVKPDSIEYNALLGLIERGNAYYKMAGVYESSKVGAPEYSDIEVLAKPIIERFPERVLWGSNWPHVSGPIENAPNDAILLDKMMEWMGSDQTRQQIFVENPQRLYW